MINYAQPIKFQGFDVAQRKLLTKKNKKVATHFLKNTPRQQ